MLIKKESLKPFTTDLPVACHEIIKAMLADSSGPELFCHRLDSLSELCGQTGKVEFSQYYEVLNMCDSVLQFAVERNPARDNMMNIDCSDYLDNVVISILKFASVLFENTFFRSVYSSFLELIKLLDTIKPKILTHTLRLLVSISKTSRYIMQHVSVADQKQLSSKLMAIYECWDKCESNTITDLIKSDELSRKAKISPKISNDITQSFDSLTLQQANALLYNHFNVMEDDGEEVDKITPMIQLRFNFYMDNLETRIDSVIHCLMSMSVVSYSRCLLDDWQITSVVNDIMIEEICELVQLEPSSFDEKIASLVDNLRTESLKTLASIVFLDKRDKLQLVVENLGLNSYLGYAANVMRNVVRKLKTGETTTESTAFITALFSLIYHIAGFEIGGSSLVNISTVPTLLDVVSLTSLPDSLISFATRAVRIIDILTSISFQEFNTHDGIQIVVCRLVYEVDKCREFVEQNQQPSNSRFVCHHHRSALIKSLLNFLKRSVVDSIYVNHSRRIMDGDLPKALVHIFETPQYYGASLVHCALELTTVFIYQEPAQLNSIQDCGVSLAIIKLFSSNHFPISREIVLSLPNISSAMCLNERGLTIFNEQKPLIQIFRIIFSTAFIQVLRKRKTELISAGGQLGIHFDEFMRHQPTLRRELIVAFVTILDEIIAKANDSEINVAAKPTTAHGNKSTDTTIDSKSKTEPESSTTERARRSISMQSFSQSINNWNEFSDEKFQELKGELEKSRRTHLVAEASTEKKTNFELVQDGNSMPLSDYMVLAIKMIEAILSNSTVADNSTAMIESKLIEKLLSFFSTERIMPIVSNPNYLHSLPSVFRLLLQQSRSIQPFVIIGRIIKEQLSNFHLPEDITELTTQSKVTELNRLSSLVSVFLSFLRMSLTSNAQESRILIFQYLSNDADGLKFIGEISSVLQKFGKCIAHFNKEFRESVLTKSRKNTITQPQISVEITTNTTSGDVLMDTSDASPTQVPKEEATPTISAPYSLMSSIHKNLIEVVCQFGRSINSRTRRTVDGMHPADNNKIAKELLLGVKAVLENVDYSDNWPFYIQNSLTMVRRLICDESNATPYPLMLSYFVETRCHSLFFEIGEKLLKEESFDTIGAPLLYWLETLSCLLNVENITNLRSRNDRLSNRESFVIEDYLKLVQGDAVSVVGKIFERLLDTHIISQNKKEDESSTSFDSSQLLDKVLEIFKELFRGIFYLHNKNKKSPAPVATLPPNEVDSGNVEILMDMGFEHSQAIRALSLYQNVDEAAEHLLFSGAMQAQPFALNVGGQPEQPEEAPENVAEQQEGTASGGGDINAPVDETTETPVVEKPKEVKQKSIDFKQAISYLCDELVPKCLHLMEKEPSIVYSVAELLRVFIYDPEIKEWAETMLIRNIFVRELNTTLTELSTNFEKADEMQIKQFASQVHLICLLWSGFDDVYINSLDDCEFYKNVIEVVSQIINTGKHVAILLAPLILWLDLYKKHFCLVKRRSVFNNDAIEGSINWFYWLQDDQHYGSTNVIRRDFSPIYSAEITTAFKAGKDECKLKMGDKNYVIDFVTMTQKQSDRSTSTPIYGSVKLKKDFDIDTFINAEQGLQNSGEDSLKLVELIMKMLKLSVSNADYQSELIFSLVSLVHRLTLNAASAQKFIELGGIESLVKLQCNKPTTLLSTAVTLTLRNCVINEELTSYAVARIFSSLNAGLPISLSEHNNLSMPSKYHRSMKECRRFLRLLSPFCDQNLQSYVETMRELVTHKDFGELQLKNPSMELPVLEDSYLDNLKKVFSTITDELFQYIDNKTTCTERILQPSSLILIIAELIRSYPKAADSILSLQHNQRSFLQLLLENIILDGKQSTEMIVAANAIFFSIINGCSNAECNDQIVQIIQDSLKNVIESVASKEGDLNKEEGKEFCQKLTTLAKFVSMLKESNSAGTNPRDSPKRTFVHVVHDKNLLLEFVKAIRLVPLDHSMAAETTNTMFKFLEDFCRVIGVAKADVAAREFAVNNPGQATTSTNPPADSSANPQQVNDQSTSANNDIQPQNAEAIVNRLEINDGNQQVLLEVVEAPDEIDEEDVDHEGVGHIEFNGFNNMEDEFDETAEMLFENQLPPRSNSSSSSSDDSNDPDRTEAMEQHNEEDAEHDQQQHALNQLNESVANAEAANSNIVRNLEQLNNGLNEIDLSLRRHQNAIRTMMEESEEEPNDGARESDDDDIEIAEDSTDEEEETEEDDANEQDEMPSAQNDADFRNDFAIQGGFNLDIEMLPNETVAGRARTGGLLQIRNGAANETIMFPGGGSDLASQFSLLTEYLAGYYNASTRRNPRSNIVLNTLRGSNGESFRNRLLTPNANGGLPNAAARTENYHPLLRRPSRFGQISTTTPASNTLDLSRLGRFNPEVGGVMLLPDAPLDQIENFISSIVSSRARGHRSTHSSRHHRGLHRQNALRSRPLFTAGRDFTHPRMFSLNVAPHMNGQFSNNTHFEDEQQLMNALQDPCYQSFNRRTVDSFIPFMLDRVSASTRLVNANSVQYVGLIISAYLAEACRQRIDPPAPVTQPEQVFTDETQSTEPIQDTPNDRRNEDEAQSIDSVSVDSSELTNRFENLAQNVEDEETRDSRNGDLDDGERTPQNVPEEEPQQQMETNEVSEQSTSTPIQPVESSEAGEQPSAENVENAESAENVEDQPGPSNDQPQEEDDGIDPAFLAALPEDIREEVIRDHQRQQRLNQLQRRQRQQSATVVETEATTNEANAPAAENQPQAEELDQEFLAALPPELQEEVLAQHLAQQTARNNTNQNAENAPAADAIAFLDSLNPTLRAQVLADADESVIQILPQNLAAEANRIRRDYEHEQLIRLADMRSEHRNYAWRTTEGTFPENINGTTSPASIVQILDQEAISTLALFYFFNNEKFTISKFQRVFKVIAMHPGTCDFVLRSLLSILKAACIEDWTGEEKELDNSRWAHSFKMQSSSNTAEKVLYLNKDNKIIVNRQFRVQVVSRVLDTLNLLARQSAAHFFNSSLRFHASKDKPAVEKPAGLSQFWKVVEKFDSNYKASREVKELEPIAEMSDEDIRNCPFGLLLDISSKFTISASSQFLEKVLRVFHSVLHIPSTVTNTKQEIPLATNDETNQFLLSKLKKLVTAVIDASSGDDSFRDFRSFLVQFLYAFPSMRYSIFVILYDIVRNQGTKLTILLKQLRESFEEEGETSEKTVEAEMPGTSKDAEESEQKEFPSLKVLSSKRNSLKKLLNTLTVISFIRQQLAELYTRRRRPTEVGNKYFTQEDMEREDNLLHRVLDDLNDLWDILSYCLDKISHSKDNRALMGLQSAAESFFLLHSLAISNPAAAQIQPVTQDEQPPATTEQSTEQPAASASQEPTTPSGGPIKKLDDPKLSRFTEKILEFAGKHRTVLNQILRGNNSTMEMLAVLSQFPKLLDFDVKRKYFNREIKKLENRSRMHHDDVVVRIRRSHLFSDAYRELFRLRPAEWKSRFYIIFEGEEGQDAGGLLREFYSVITREIFNPNYALFITAPGDGVTFMVNKASYVNHEHLDYFKFAGHIIAKAIYDQKQLDCYFTRAFYKQILSLPVNYTDIESFDVEYYKNLMFLLDHPIETSGVDLNFNLEVEEFGVRSWRELKENGNNIAVTDENKEEYVRLVCREKLTGAVQKQLDAFLAGFYEIIPRNLISIFNEQELELLISGLPEIDIDDLAANTEYKQYTKTSPQIQWLWRSLRSFEKEDLAKFLQFVLGSSKVPLNGFSELQGMNGTQKFTVQKDTRSTERLPAAHTCFNQLDLPVYDSYEKLREMLLKAIRECSSFGFA